MIKGQKTNKLTFIEYAEPRINFNNKKRVMGVFECECGNRSIKDVSSVKHGRPKQCFDCARIIINQKRVTHGLIKHNLYKKFRDMSNRCYNKNVKAFVYYGGRGIKICDEWRGDFKLFYDWAMANGWKEGLTIDRIDVNKDYSPDNCRFLTMQEQGFNKRNTFYVEYKGEKVSLSKFLFDKGISSKYRSIWEGIRKGKTFEYFINKYNL